MRNKKCLFDNQSPHAVADEHYRSLLFAFRFSGALYVHQQFSSEGVQAPRPEIEGHPRVIAHRIDPSIGEVVFQEISEPERIAVNCRVRLAFFAPKLASEFTRPDIFRFVFWCRL